MYRESVRQILFVSTLLCEISGDFENAKILVTILGSYSNYTLSIHVELRLTKVIH